MQSVEPVARVGRDRRLGLLHREQNITCAARWSAKHFRDMEKRGRQFGENCLAKYVGDLEKRGRRFGEIYLAKYVGDLEKRDGAVMAISYWSSLRSSLELGDHKWRLNRNGEKLWRPKLYSS